MMNKMVRRPGDLINFRNVVINEQWIHLQERDSQHEFSNFELLEKFFRANCFTSAAE